MKKRVKVTGTGKFKVDKACKRHLLSDKTKKAKGRNKYGLLVSGSEIKKIREQLPHL
ncbi:MAG: bL35 family ribosomal protein [bacterium]|nr:bL35 family ribosomal protein [bacterium]MDP3380279.1 bL35 family ribosomal protein [bacterium]